MDAEQIRECEHAAAWLMWDPAGGCASCGACRRAGEPDASSETTQKQEISTVISLRRVLDPKASGGPFTLVRSHRGTVAYRRPNADSSGDSDGAGGHGLLSCQFAEAGGSMSEHSIRALQDLTKQEPTMDGLRRDED